MKTTKFFANIGINEGYSHRNDSKTRLFVDLIAAAWQSIAARVYIASGIYVGAVISPARTIYHQDWGCPSCGEESFLITGEFNPVYANIAEDLYRQAVVEILRDLATELNQSIVQAVFHTMDFEYIDLRKTPVIV